MPAAPKTAARAFAYARTAVFSAPFPDHPGIVFEPKASMSTMLKRIVGAVCVAGPLLAAQPAMADVINLICRFPGYAGIQQLNLVWVDPNANHLYEVLSIGVPGTAASVDDALARANRGEMKEFPATITPTSIAWTDSNGEPVPTQINRLSGVVTFSWPNAAPGECEKGDVPFPAAKF